MLVITRECLHCGPIHSILIRGSWHSSYFYGVSLHSVYSLHYNVALCCYIYYIYFVRLWWNYWLYYCRHFFPRAWIVCSFFLLGTKHFVAIYGHSMWIPASEVSYCITSISVYVMYSIIYCKYVPYLVCKLYGGIIVLIRLSAAHLCSECPFYTASRNYSAEKLSAKNSGD